MGSQTFTPSATPAQVFQFIVPAGVTSLEVDMTGGAGGAFTGYAKAGGGRVTCELSVTAGDILDIRVAQAGETGGSNSSEWGGGFAVFDGGGGGGYSSIRPAGGDQASSLIVAGGGGGRSGPPNYVAGGAGGGLIGQAGTNDGGMGGGQGGTQSAGGLAGTGSTGASLVAPQDGDTTGQGNGGRAGYRGGFNRSGGGGGGGWHGGGGGAADVNSGGTRAGGGGGSSYADSTVCSNVVHTQGYNDADGYVTLTWVALSGIFVGAVVF